jgi:hypothetical protein
MRVPMHARDSVMNVGAIKKHYASKGWAEEVDKDPMAMV